MIGNKTAIAKALQEYSIGQTGEKTFENLYGAIDLEGKRAASSLETEFADDVAAAYSASEIGRQNLLASNLLTGAKEDELDYLNDELEKAYEQYKSNYLSNLSAVEENIQKAKGFVTSMIGSEAENYYKLEQSFYPYLQALYKEQSEKGTNLFDTAGWSKYIEDVDGEKRLKSWSDISKDFYNNTGGHKELNETGTAFYDQMLNYMENAKTGVSYMDWLKTYDKDGELYDWVTSANPYGYQYDMGGANRRLSMFKNLYGMKSDDESFATLDRMGDVKQHFTDKLNFIENEIDDKIRLEEFSKILDEYDTLKSGMSEEQMKEYEELIYSGTNFTNDNYDVQGLGSGRNNDDIDITIGMTKNNRKAEYDLLVGDAVPKNSVSILNKLATGNSETVPKEGKLIVVKNKMYIYTKKGWKYVTDDNKEGQLNEAINAFVKNEII